ncbi:Homeobox-leucine zipper protein [Actinidia chinensis var. chinensis]|uniref:Homeobox-leucine zipper protein n=1 Tax=Actinidia chinensis var. chinensis TaxID=1590841 RepID=A0A2R6QWN6_ACTCC|nr:Homeobox-leucine zipper protein [Actinidia chinensis var. chinensis]
MDIGQNVGEINMGGIGDDDLESKSFGGENQDGGSGEDDQDSNRNKARKRRYHRHTQHQIQEMETFFKECPHPDEKQRRELSRELGLEPLQIKFWFQNKRTQLKLRTENERLRAENLRYREAISNSSCPSCKGPTAGLGEMSFDEQHLRHENTRLREEIERMSALAANYAGKTMVNYNSTNCNGTEAAPVVTPSSLQLGVGADVYGGGGGGDHVSDKQVAFDVAFQAMEELTRLAQMGEPLWSQGMDPTTYVLNEEEYLRTFPTAFGLRPPVFRCEASRQTALVMISNTDLVQILMDVNQWITAFAGIISKATTLEILSEGISGDYNGALQMMSAEFQVLSPLVPTREAHFVRYCKHYGDGTWAVVDVSLDSFYPCPPVRCRRRPSGCLIQEMPNDYSKVTWIEHVEVDDRGVHNIYRPLVNSGLAFGAKRWLSTLSRHCERFANAVAENPPPTLIIGNNVIISLEGRRGMFKLAERMAISFCCGVSASTAHTWTTISGSGADDIRVMTQKSIDDPGRPPGIALSAATSFWVPVPPKTVFDLLRHQQYRNEWDILSNGGAIQQIAHIPTGQDDGNCMSLLRVNDVNGNQNNMLILQESCIDPTGSFVIYAPVDALAMDMVLGGADPDYVALLPSGFAILPDGPITGHGAIVGEAGSGGSLVTVAFQILVDSAPNAKLSIGSVATVNNLITCTVEKIKAAVGGDQYT